ncbi:MAG: ABC transporter ATP-binding protein, partial [Comamonas sp.]
ASTPAAAAPVVKRKLSYKEQRELEQLPAQIAALETEQATIQAALADGSLYANDNARALQLQQRDGEIEAALMTALERWELLSA